MGKKSDRQQNRANALNNEAVFDDPKSKSHNAADFNTKALRHRHPLPNADSAIRQQNEKDNRGHETQAANYDQDQDHELTEGAPLRPDILQRESGHTGSGGCRKKCREKP